jgi:hypothetical protein
MTAPSHAEGRLDVSRSELAEALQLVARAMGEYSGAVELTFGDGQLSVEAANTSAKASAAGSWPVPIFVGALWVRRLAKTLPEDNPLILRVEHGRIHLDRYSEPCALVAADLGLKPERPQIDEQQIINDSMRLLKPLHIKRSDLEALVSDAKARGPASWSPEDKQMVSIVAKTWVLLAPLGIETPDLRRLVELAVRNAWK